MPVSAPRADTAHPADMLLDVARGLYAELHQRPPAAGAVALGSDLDRDLGFDSLARVELLRRVEQRFGVHLRQADVLATAETLSDLLRLIESATAANVVSLRPDRATMPVKPGPAPRTAIGTPPRAATLDEVLEWHVRSHPEMTHAIVLRDSTEQSVSYLALRDGARTAAGCLQRAGVQPGDTVALMLPTTVDYLHAFFGVLFAGAVPVPIYPPARASQLEEHVFRHARILSNAQVSALITSQQTRTVARLLRARVRSLHRVLSIEELKQAAANRVLRPAPTPESIALLQYTSGSTGSPKGVVLTHRQLLANIQAMGAATAAGESDVFVSWLPLYHDMGLIGAWLGSLYFGCLFVTMSPTFFLGRPERWLRAIQQYRGTLSASPNFGYELCARRIADAELDGLDLSSWRVAFNGAETVSPDTLERFRQRFAPYGFRPEAMTPVYGLAEAAVGLTFPPLGRGPVVDCVDRDQMSHTGRAVPVRDHESAALRFVSCGRPLPGYEVRIVDETGLELPERTEGLVQFTGPSATEGYYDNKDATRELLHGEWRDTGDRGYVASGELYITGRVKDLIIRRGRHVYPEEVERAVGEVPAIRKGCVAAFGTKNPVSGTERLVVVAETRLTDSNTREQLTHDINQCVVEAVGEPPDEIVLAPPHSVLKTSSGKLRRVATRQAYEQGTLFRGTAGVMLQILRIAVESVRPTGLRLRRASAQLIYGVYAWIVLIGWTLPIGVLLSLIREPARAWRVTHRATKTLIRLWGIPFQVKGETLLDLSQPHVIVMNHASYLDSLFAAALLSTPHRFVAKVELQRIPMLRFWLHRLGTLFIERFAPVQSATELERLKAELARGHSIIIFPEGTFTRIPGLHPFRLGAFQAAVSSDVPVVPITLRGTRALLREGQVLPRWTPVTAIVGRPIRADVGEDAFAAAVHLRDAVRKQILANCGEADLA